MEIAMIRIKNQKASEIVELVNSLALDLEACRNVALDLQKQVDALTDKNESLEKELSDSKFSTKEYKNE
jgi:uncharacterized NAD(P)/FAD-binding protein YdhS